MKRLGSIYMKWTQSCPECALSSWCLHLQGRYGTVLYLIWHCVTFQVFLKQVQGSNWGSYLKCGMLAWTCTSNGLGIGKSPFTAYTFLKRDLPRTTKITMVVAEKGEGKEGALHLQFQPSFHFSHSSPPGGKDHGSGWWGCPRESSWLHSGPVTLTIQLGFQPQDSIWSSHFTWPHERASLISSY